MVEEARTRNPRWLDNSGKTWARLVSKWGLGTGVPGTVGSRGWFGGRWWLARWSGGGHDSSVNCMPLLGAWETARSWWWSAMCFSGFMVAMLPRGLQCENYAEDYQIKFPVTWFVINQSISLTIHKTHKNEIDAHRDPNNPCHKLDQRPCKKWFLRNSKKMTHWRLAKILVV